MKHIPIEHLHRALRAVGHEVRNGLNALQMNNFLLQGTVANGPPDRSVLDRNGETIRDLASLVDLTARMADLHAGTLEPSPSSVSAVAVLHDAASALRRLLPRRRVEGPPDPTAADPRIAAERGLATWAVITVARSGFQADCDDAVLCLGVEPSDRAVALAVRSTSPRIAPMPDPLRDPAAWSGQVSRAALELAVARGVVEAIGARLEPGAEHDGPAWSIVVDRG